jgi:hypothetical protein
VWQDPCLILTRLPKIIHRACYLIWSLPQLYQITHQPCRIFGILGDPCLNCTRSYIDPVRSLFFSHNACLNHTRSGIEPTRSSISYILIIMSCRSGQYILNSWIPCKLLPNHYLIINRSGWLASGTGLARPSKDIIYFWNFCWYLWEHRDVARRQIRGAIKVWYKVLTTVKRGVPSDHKKPRRASSTCCSTETRTEKG